MSIINGQQFANTTFPDEIQNLPTFTDISEATSTDKTNYIKYIKALLGEDYVTAGEYYNNLSDEFKLNAQKMNQLSDTIGAIQAVFNNTSTFTNILTDKQNKWESIINKFTYLGDWQEIESYSASATYNVGDLVYYNNSNKVWKCIQNTTAGLIPQENTYWTQWYLKNNMVSYTNNGRTLLYIANQNISTISNPSTDFASDNPQWMQLSFIGNTGANGEQFSFEGEYESDKTYQTGNLVEYNQNCYSSLTDDNIGNTPDVSTSDWKLEFQFTMKQIPVQSTMPTNQISGDIWFQTIELS